MIAMQSTRNDRSTQPTPAPALGRESAASDPSATTVRRSLAPIALLTFEASAVSSLHRLGAVAFLRLPGPDVSAWQGWMRGGHAADAPAPLAPGAAPRTAWGPPGVAMLCPAPRARRSAPC